MAHFITTSYTVSNVSFFLLGIDFCLSFSGLVIYTGQGSDSLGHATSTLAKYKAWAVRRTNLPRYKMSRADFFCTSEVVELCFLGWIKYVTRYKQLSKYYSYNGSFVNGNDVKSAFVMRHIFLCAFYNTFCDDSHITHVAFLRKLNKRVSWNWIASHWIEHFHHSMCAWY